MNGIDKENGETEKRVEEVQEKQPPGHQSFGHDPKTVTRDENLDGTGESSAVVTEKPVENGDTLLEEARREWERTKEELNDRLLRQRADYENYKRIHRQELERSREDAVYDFIGGFLPVLDNLERALDASRQEKDLPPAYTEGLELIYEQFLKLLDKEGVTAIVAEGKPFDPLYHHAVMRAEEGEGESGVVAEELCRGYLYRDRVLRPAMVKVY